MMKMMNHCGDGLVIGSGWSHNRRLRWWMDGDGEGGLVRFSKKVPCLVIRRVFDGAFGGVGVEEVVVGEGVVVTSSSLEMLTNSCLGGIMVNLIFLEGFEEEALVEWYVIMTSRHLGGKRRKYEEDGDDEED
ncbi:hypothetical protein Tco_0784949 [Tanacetum coccineum]